MLPAQSLNEIPSHFNQHLTYDDHFYTDIDSVRNETMPKIYEIKDALEYDDQAKVLFAGHSGSGKSTELIRLKKLVENDYKVVMFSINETSDVVNISSEDLLLSNIIKVLEEVNLSEAKLEPLLSLMNIWLGKIERIKEEIQQNKSTVFNELNNLEEVYEYIKNIHTILKIGDREKVLYQAAIEKSLADLLELSKKFYEIMQSYFDKPILMIIEDLDKVDTKRAKEIFIDRNSTFSAIPVRVIYTVPIFLMYVSETCTLCAGTFYCMTLPMAKTRNRQDSNLPNQITIEKLKYLVSKRMNLSLFEDDVLEEIIFKTGGVLRDLFYVISKSATGARYNGQDKITKTIANHYMMERGNYYYKAISGARERGIDIKAIVDKIINIYTDNDTKPPIDELIIELLRAQVLIEYNGTGWYGLHPLLIDNFIESGKMNA